MDAVEPEVLWDGGCCRDNRLPDEYAPVDAPHLGRLPGSVSISESRGSERREVEVALDKGGTGRVDVFFRGGAGFFGVAGHSGWWMQSELLRVVYRIQLKFSNLKKP